MTLTPESEETIYVGIIEKLLLDGYMPEKYVEDTASELLDLVTEIIKDD